jgi:RHS repeat-associated protein
VTAAGAGTTYTYDPNGNLTSKTEGSDTWGYEWNADNQLTRVTKNSIEQARFSYDPMRRRVEKVAGGVTTSYTYDSEDILREVRGATTLKYVHGLGIDEPLAVDDGATVSYFHADALGSVVKATSGSGTVSVTRQLDAWGSPEVGATEAGYSFTAREWDPETSLYYYRARYYDPKGGRFLSEDPIRFAGGANFYRYAQASPTNYTDPSGLFVWFAAPAGVAAAKTAAGAAAWQTAAAGAAAAAAWGWAAWEAWKAYNYTPTRKSTTRQYSRNPPEDQPRYPMEFPVCEAGGSNNDDCWNTYQARLADCRGDNFINDPEGYKLCVQWARVIYRICQGLPPAEDPFTPDSRP